MENLNDMYLAHDPDHGEILVGFLFPKKENAEEGRIMVITFGCPIFF